MNGKLVFVYNANSGKINAWLDTAHKIVSPKTYQCRLCDLTYGLFKENEQWVRFRESVIANNKDLQLEFLHIDEFEKIYENDRLPTCDYPVILHVAPKNDAITQTLPDSIWSIFMSASKLKTLTTTDQLMNAITYKINNQ